MRFAWFLHAYAVVFLENWWRFNETVNTMPIQLSQTCEIVLFQVFALQTLNESWLDIKMQYLVKKCVVSKHSEYQQIDVQKIENIDVITSAFTRN